MAEKPDQWFAGWAEAVRKARAQPPPEAREAVLKPVIRYIRKRFSAGQLAQLHFICTHNSRRSQFAQVWATAAADCLGIPARCTSGGTEVTELNERVAASLVRSGFTVSAGPGQNPVYRIAFAGDRDPVLAWSKRFGDPSCPSEGFAAVLTCSDADEACPFIPGADLRIPVRYEDPKAYDGTDAESEMYDRCSMQIASEMFYVFARIK